MSGWSPTGSDGLLIANLHVVQRQARRDQTAYVALLLGDAADGGDDLEAELVDEAIIFLEHLALEQPEAFDRIGAPAEIHPRFVELELDAARHQPIERNVDRHAEVEREIGADREAVELADPLPIDAARRVA